MKVHDTKELKLRARSHAKADHIQQGTYGNASANGKPTYEGCAVSCLATPHRLKDLTKYVKEKGTYDSFDETYYVEFGGEEQRKKVAKEFGINQKLMQVAEGFFEAQEYHGAAIEFVKDFACALNEGADITPRMVNKWTTDNLNLRNILNFTEIGAHSFDIEADTVKFRSWLRSIKANG
jgi:hypothetical protein